MSKLRVLLLPLLLLVPAATSESAPIFYDFTLDFEEGDLAGQNFTGSFSVDGDDCPGGICDGEFFPTDLLHTLLSFDITVDGVAFNTQDDVSYPSGPFVGFNLGTFAYFDFRAIDPEFLEIVFFPGVSNRVFFGLNSEGEVTNLELRETAVPEPATLMLFGLGGAGLARRWRQRRTQ